MAQPSFWDKVGSAMRGEYPATPGHSNPTTSLEAARSMDAPAPKLRLRILSELQLRADVGATCDELEQAYGMPHQTVSARLREMALSGSIVDSGHKRKTRSGRNAIVWHATKGWR